MRAIRAKGKEIGIETPIFDSLMEANDNQVSRAFEKIKASGKKNITMLGLSFKAGTDDLRESPLVTLADLLLKNGFNLKIYDTNVYKAREMEGANQHYIKEVITDISNCLVESAEEATKHGDFFVIGNNGEDFSKIIQSIQDEATPVLDLVRIDADIEERQGYHGICW